MLVWGSCGAALFSELEQIHVRVAKLIYGLDWLTPSDEVLLQTKWKSLKQMYIREVLCFVYKMCLQRCSVPPSSIVVKTGVVLPKLNTDFIKKSVKFAGASLWNSLDNRPTLKNIWHWVLKVQYRNFVLNLLNLGAFND